MSHSRERRRARRARTHRRPRAVRQSQWMTVAFMLAALVLLLVFRDELALRLSGLLGAAGGQASDLQPSQAQQTSNHNPIDHKAHQDTPEPSTTP